MTSLPRMLWTLAMKPLAQSFLVQPSGCASGLATSTPSKGVNARIKFTLANLEPLITKPDVWDKDPWLLGVTNGVVDLRTGEHRAGRPTDYMRQACP